MAIVAKHSASPRVVTAPTTTCQSAAAAVITEKKKRKSAEAYEAQVAEWINQARARYQLPPLQRNPVLHTLATAHVQEMVKTGQVAHSTSSHSKLQKRLASKHAVGENVHCAASIQNLFQSMQRDVICKGNIYSSKFTEMDLAIGKDRTTGMVYICQLFRKR